MPDPRPLTHAVRLDELIRTIKDVHAEPLDQLTDAVLVGEHLGEVSDHLIGHFVDQARRSGASWTEIGRCMGVSKQAAQQRNAPKVPDVTPDLSEADGFSRFTTRARNTITAAHDAAVDAGNTQIVPDHLVLGLLAERDSLAARALVQEGIDLDAVAAAATAALPGAAGDPPELVPFDGASKKVLELTVREALRLGHNYVGTEHLLLALLELEDGEGLLTGAGADKAAIEALLVELLAVVSGGGAG
ncbi:MAG: Clp protease N-terminal domain-containing protein [Microthrixaceae bacterium]